MSTFYRTLLRTGLFLVLFLIAPTVALAHERWFVQNWQEYSPQFGLLLTPQMEFLRYYDRSNQIILAVQTAIRLIAVAVSLCLFAPNLTIGRNAFGIVLVGVEVFVAFSFISGLLTRVGALILIAVFLCTLFFYPVWAVLEQTLYVGIALYLLIVERGLVRLGPHQEPLAFFAHHWRRAPLFLRLGVGFSLTWVAFTEKLLYPRLAEVFLKMHATFNVAQFIGLTWFTNELYIL